MTPPLVRALLVCGLAASALAARARADEAPAAAAAPTEQKPAEASAGTPLPATTATAPVPGATPAVAPAEPAKDAVAAPAEPEKAPAAPRNRSLQYAKDLLAKGKYDNALKELDTAGQLPGNTPREVVEMAATRAQILLLQKKPNPIVARELLVEVLHSDPDATVLADAPESVKAIVSQLRSEQSLVLHDRIAVTRGGRPIKLRAKVVDPKSQVATVTLHYKGHTGTTWSLEPLRKDLSGWSTYIRNPEALAPAGVADGYFVDYYLTAEDGSGRVVDSNGDADGPISMEVSATKAEASAMADATQPLPTLEAQIASNTAPEPVVVVETPWYLRWYTLTGAGVVVVGGLVTAIVIASQPQEIPAHVFEIDLAKAGK